MPFATCILEGCKECILEGCKVEPALAEAVPGATWQFTRLGYFAPDAKLSSKEGLVFNRAVTLKDGWKG